MINVLVVDDSLVVAEFLCHLLRADSEIHVVGIAHNGEKAIQAAMRHKPDVITMDIHMPEMNGFEATRRIMETVPTPIVIVSSSFDPKEVTKTFLAIEAGALAIVGKPKGIGHPDLEQTARELIQTIKLMSEVKVVRRWPKKKEGVSVIEPKLVLKRTTEIQVVAIGASTGGPIVLQTILALLPRNFSAPVLIVQHMASGFTQGFAEWLTETTGFPVHLAVDGQNPRSGNAYVAPDGFHMKLDRTNRIALTTDKPENGLRPSASYLLRSVV
ncbi:MAG: chemotaxis protein CheB, partial [Acidobacteriota bacterium]